MKTFEKLNYLDKDKMFHNTKFLILSASLPIYQTFLAAALHN